MYAIVRVGNKQYRVEQGDLIVVDRMRAAEGDSVSLEPLLVSGDGEPAFEPAALARARVEAEVVRHERGKKVHVLKFKPKRGYKRRTGHRSDLTRLRIAKLSLGGGRGS